MLRSKILFASLAVLAMGLSSCKKYLEVGSSPVQLSGEDIFQSDLTATSAMLAVYPQMESNTLAYNLLVYPGIGSDELNNHQASEVNVAFATNSLTADNSTVGGIWSNFYKYIYSCNAVLEGLDGNTAVSAPVTAQLRGEALFVRSWCYFYLARLFGAVPFIDFTATEQHLHVTQISSDAILRRCAADLGVSIGLLGEGFVNGVALTGGERVRPNRFAAAALLARIYLYLGDHARALEFSSQVIGSSQFQLETDLTKVFLKTSKEAIWQLQATLPNFNTIIGALLVSTAVNPPIISLTSSLVSRFDTGDLRRTHWTRETDGTRVHTWANKYKVGANAGSITEYTMLLRLAELYLIRAEAKLYLGDVDGAVSDLNKIRQRAGVSLFVGSDPLLIQAAIDKERSVELFAEMGDRWLEVGRRGLGESIMAPLKGASWSEDDLLYPIPTIQISRFPGMVQNPGY